MSPVTLYSPLPSTGSVPVSLPVPPPVPPVAWPEAEEARHRAHCPMCTADDGVEVKPAEDFVDALFTAHAPWLMQDRREVRLPELLIGTSRFRAAVDPEQNPDTPGTVGDLEEADDEGVPEPDTAPDDDDPVEAEEPRPETDSTETIPEPVAVRA